MRFSYSFFLSCIIALLLWGMSTECQAQDYTITVSAGGFDRSETVVSFSFPNKVPQGVYIMKNAEGESVYLQVGSHNKGRFILEELAAGKSKTFNLTIEPIATPPEEVNFSMDKNTVTFKSAGKKVLSYFYKENNPPKALDERYERAGYIHPVYSPDGVVLTNHLDLKMHSHHYGVWSAWPKTNFQGRHPDFWNVQDNKGRINHVDSLEVAWDGPVYGGFRAENYFVDLTLEVPVIALNEAWKVLVYNTDGTKYLMFDLILTQTTNTGAPLILPQYRYGGMAVRGSGSWDNPDKVNFLTSKGYGRIKGNATRARWCAMAGLVHGEQAGLAVLGHPGNFRAPQPVRINPETPYFVYAPVQLDTMVIEPGEPYVARYRFITFDGKTNPTLLNRLWNDYAYPPGVTVVAN